MSTKPPWRCLGAQRIGNSTFADINIIWARDESSNQVKGFVVGKDNPGFAVKKIEHKMAPRVVQNGLITLKGTPANAKLPASQRTPASCSLASDRMFTTGI
jgi:alkylation response protein AidB-like acyl-CoA dehydrogenase